jgi:hypothetical protein
MTVQKVTGRCAWYLLALPIQIRRLGQRAISEIVLVFGRRPVSVRSARYRRRPNPEQELT